MQRVRAPVSRIIRAAVFATALLGCGGSRHGAPSDAGTFDATATEASATHFGIVNHCADCHDSGRPFAAKPTGHRETNGLDCSNCHRGARADGSWSWAGAQYHVPGSYTPDACLPCHRKNAPTSSVGWQSATYSRAPFDYGTNPQGIPHGGGEDCVVCHAGPGTGTWGNRPDWEGGRFEHVPFSLAERTCIACHLSQRPDLQPKATPASAAALLGIDHAAYPTLDCIGCHSATVDADSYVDYVAPATGTLPGGDWKGGQAFPGSAAVGYPGEHLELQVTTLTLSSTRDVVTSATLGSGDFRDFMIHTAAEIPSELRPAPDGAPDYGRCWHCHNHRDGVVTRFPAGKFHSSLSQYAPSPGAPITPLPQPTQGCIECHAATRPTGVVARSTLQPMDHAIEPAASLECSTCHADTMGVFGDGIFHASVGTEAPRDCLLCHYLTMADGPTADVQDGTAYAMKHLSPQVTVQTCPTCHPSSLANASNPEPAAASWRPGHFHAVLSTQPTACNDCHGVSVPVTSLATFDHASLTTSRRDCGDCHAFPGTGTTATPNWLGGRAL